MNEFYRAIGTTKQNVHQRLNKLFERTDLQEQLIPLMEQVRKDHPLMGAAEMYRKLVNIPIGRDKFRQMYNECGYKIKQKRNPRRTTDSLGVTRFDNLLQGRELTGINQVWVSDITYFDIDDKFYYLTFIMDLFSRKIIGYSASKSLRTIDTTLPALKMALLKRKELNGTIFHSDGGGQYYCKEFLAITRKAGMRNSMGVTAYENPHAERLNGTIKNAYLYPYDPKDFMGLKNMLQKAVRMYNTQKPHKALNGISPLQFELTLTSKQTIFNNLIPKQTSKTVNHI